MKNYDEFRLVMSPGPEGRPPWSVYVDECPPGVPAHLSGAAGFVGPQISRDDLRKLRAREPWPDAPQLMQIGQRVWGSIMTPKALQAFSTARVQAANRGRGLRITLVTQGDLDTPDDQHIALCELPLEVLYDDIENQ